MNWFQAFVATSLLVVTAQAQTIAYKYQIEPGLGISTDCTDDGELERSSVRFYLSQAELNSNKDMIRAEIRVSACIWGGGVFKNRYRVFVPRFVFTKAPAIQGVFPLKSPDFSQASIETKGNVVQIRLFQKGGPWKAIDPIEVSLGSKGNFPQKLRFFVKSKKRWVSASFRLKETQR